MKIKNEKNTNFYDGVKLLSMTDLNGQKPEIYICTSNRSGGKTTWFSRYFLNRFLKEGEKFCLIYRFKYELDNVSDKFFKDIRTLFFQDYEMKSEKRAMGSYHELFMKNIYDKDEPESWLSCGYAVSLNSADQLKKYSHLLSDVKRMLFDEFQSETNRYCDNEIQKFISIHTSLARGKGEQVRYLPVFMISNPISLINPYYAELGISQRLKTNTRFLKGIGFVLEQGFNETASNLQKKSGFNKAFSLNPYVQYSTNANYLNDNNSFIEKMSGKSNYIATIKYNNNEYAIREFPEEGVMYCDDRADKTFPFKIAVNSGDHQVNYIMLKKNDFFISSMRYYFERGVFRFRNLKSKEAVLKMLSY